MSTYIRYHVASGHIDTKMVIPTEDGLALYEREGYTLVEANVALGDTYVAPDGFQPRTYLMRRGNKHNAVIDEENVTLTGLPTDLWLTVNSGEPVKVAPDGTFEILSSQRGADNEARAEPVGKYSGTGWKIVWDELSNMKDRASAAIDVAAEAARLRVVTPGSGQAMTYMRKADAARTFLAGDPISTAQMQRLQDEATRLEITVQEAAQAIVEMADLWEGIDATIDSTRLKAKADIKDCTTGAAMETLIREITWPV